MKKDLAISIMGHISVIAIIIIVNPATGVLRGTPDIMNVDLSGLGSPAPASQVEQGTLEPHKEEAPPEPEPEPETITPPETPESVTDQTISDQYTLASKDTLDTIVEEPKPKPKPRSQNTKPKPKPKPPAETKPDTQLTMKPPPEEQQGPREVVSDAGRGLEVGGALGSGDGTTGDGRGSGSFGLPYSIPLIERKIRVKWRNPVTSSGRLSCTIYLQIARDGHLMGKPTVERSSGITTFDNEAIFAIMRVDQFPEFPSGFDYDFLGIHLEFAYVP